MKNHLSLIAGIIFLTALMMQCHQAEKKDNAHSLSFQGGKTEIQDLTDKIRSDSLNPDHYQKRAIFYLDQENVNSALGDINKALQLDNKNARYFVTLADIYLKMVKIPACLEALKKAENLDPENNDALVKQAQVYLILKDYTNTFNYVKKALNHDKINPVAYFTGGYAAMETGDTLTAVRNFLMAVDQDQNYYDALLQLGVLYSDKKDPLGIDYYQRAIHAWPNRKEAYYLLGLTYQANEKIAEAFETYEKLVVIAPDFKEVHYNLGYLNLVYKNDFPTAIRYFTEAIRLDPKYADAFFNRGYSYELSGDFINARNDYQQALQLTPNYERAIEGMNRLDKLQ